PATISAPRPSRPASRPAKLPPSPACTPLGCSGCTGTGVGSGTGRSEAMVSGAVPVTPSQVNATWYTAPGRASQSTTAVALDFFGGMVTVSNTGEETLAWPLQPPPARSTRTVTVSPGSTISGSTSNPNGAPSPATATGAAARARAPALSRAAEATRVACTGRLRVPGGSGGPARRGAGARLDGRHARNVHPPARAQSRERVVPVGRAGEPASRRRGPRPAWRPRTGPPACPARPASTPA